MAQSLTLFFPVKPTAKGRPRLGRGVVYTPRKTLLAEEALRLYLHNQLPQNFKISDEPVEIEVIFGLKRPKSIPKGRLLPVCRPDIDNYIKLIFDAFNGVLWEDDSQIHKVTASKVYSSEDHITLSIHF